MLGGIQERVEHPRLNVDGPSFDGLGRPISVGPVIAVASEYGTGTPTCLRQMGVVGILPSTLKPLYISCFTLCFEGILGEDGI